MIRLHNSMTREVEDFVPADPERVTMYVCGPTVYNTPHLGNARPAVVFDVLASLLVHVYGDDKVLYARNFTDVDDKIVAKAQELGVWPAEITHKTIIDYVEVMVALGVEQPDFSPRATHYIDHMINMIQVLIGKGNAYVAESGDVYFDIASYADHGKLTGHKQEDLNAGHRIAVSEHKRNPGDFALWKIIPDEEIGYDSPWGFGRPGWHIECSVMIKHTLGDTIDIHGGGADLRFPHHEAEISQSCCANDTDHLARYWLHNAMVLVNGEKMAKSKGNFVTVRDALAEHRPQTVRMWLLSTHYRSPLDYTLESLAQASQIVSQWHRTLDGIDAAPEANEYSTAVLEALSSDLNTPQAITALHEAFTHLGDDPERVAAGIRYAAGIMGFDLVDNDFYLRGRSDDPVRLKIEDMLAVRLAARANKDWAESDRLRDELTALGVIVEDRNGMSTWRLV